MKLHLDELASAQVYTHITPFQGLTKEQLKSIMDYGRTLHRWFTVHKYLHNLISASLIAALLITDFFVLLWLPRVFLEQGQQNGWSLILLSSVIVGGLHSWLIYSITVFSIHEGAAHELIFPPKGPISVLCNSFANNLARLSGADPVYYAANHRSHHAKFGTEGDGEFLNFVLPHRFWKTLLPFAMFTNFSDFVVHRPLSYSQSVAFSTIVSFCYNILYGYFMVKLFGVPFTLLTLLLVLPHVGFYLDRLRQFTEHNLMPLENKDGARSFGLGFWGLLIGGGPWGQPCHWMHHLVPSIPWYQQLRLHFYVKNILTPLQRKQYLLEPVTGYPKLLWQLWGMRLRRDS